MTRDVSGIVFESLIQEEVAWLVLFSSRWEKRSGGF